MSEEEKKLTLPYVSFPTFKAFINHLHEVAITDQVDNSMMPANFSGSARATVTATLKSLGLIDAENNATNYTYDSRNLLICEQFADNTGAEDSYGRRYYKYDEAERLIERLDQEQAATGYHYDLANRLVTRSFPDGQNDLFAYSKAGRLISASSNRYGNLCKEIATG